MNLTDFFKDLSRPGILDDKLFKFHHQEENIFMYEVLTNYEVAKKYFNNVEFYDNPDRFRTFMKNGYLCVQHIETMKTLDFDQMSDLCSYITDELS